MTLGMRCRHLYLFLDPPEHGRHHLGQHQRQQTREEHREHWLHQAQRTGNLAQEVHHASHAEWHGVEIEVFTKPLFAFPEVYCYLPL